jgi:hypothetical protein
MTEALTRPQEQPTIASHSQQTWGHMTTALFLTLRYTDYYKTPWVIEYIRPSTSSLIEWQVASLSGKQDGCAFHLGTLSQNQLQQSGPP